MKIQLNRDELVAAIKMYVEEVFSYRDPVICLDDVTIGIVGESKDEYISMREDIVVCDIELSRK